MWTIKYSKQAVKDSKKIGKKIKPNKIVFHNTANTAPAINEIKWLNSKDNTSTTSFHFAVDESGVYQAVSANYATYHAGDFNINNTSIGIEIAKSKLNDITEKDNGIKNATLLIVLLMNHYDIDIEDVITHYDSSGKYCPHDIFDRYGLEIFYDDIKKLDDEFKKKSAKTTAKRATVKKSGAKKKSSKKKKSKKKGKRK